MTYEEVKQMLHKSNPIGNGIDRSAYYNADKNLVIKVEKDCDCYSQSHVERVLFNNFTEDEKELLPFLEFIQEKDTIFILMAKVTVLRNYTEMKKLPEHKNDIHLHAMSVGEMVDYCTYIGIDNNWDYLARLRALIDKYEICDLHNQNIGVWNNHLTIFDLGFSGNNSSAENDQYNYTGNCTCSCEAISEYRTSNRDYSDYETYDYEDDEMDFTNE